MLSACRKANEKGVPIVFDPVGAGATKLRTETSMRLVSERSIAVVRANASEALALTPQAGATKGVDSVHSVDQGGRSGQGYSPGTADRGGHNRRGGPGHRRR